MKQEVKNEEASREEEKKVARRKKVGGGKDATFGLIRLLHGAPKNKA